MQTFQQLREKPGKQDPPPKNKLSQQMDCSVPFFKFTGPSPAPRLARRRPSRHCAPRAQAVEAAPRHTTLAAAAPPRLTAKELRAGERRRSAEKRTTRSTQQKGRSSKPHGFPFGGFPFWWYISILSSPFGGFQGENRGFKISQDKHPSLFHPASVSRD